METNTTYGPVTVISVQGKLNSDGFPQLLRQTRSLFGQGHVDLIVDLKGASEVSSGGLVALQVMAAQAAEQGGRLVLSGARPSVARTVQVMGSGEWLAIYPDADTAQSSFAVSGMRREYAAQAGQPARQAQPRRILGKLFSGRS